MTWDIVGHDWAVDFMRTSLRHDRARHAYLISGTANIGKNLLAHRFAGALNCTHEDANLRPCGQCKSCKVLRSGNHPDILYSVGDARTGSLKIDTLRELMREIALKPFASRYRVAILENFERAQPRAQDALLKTLEEPPPHAVILVLANNLEQILPTIRSRCQSVPLRPVAATTVRDLLVTRGCESDRATLLARLSSGRIGWALHALENDTIMTERDDILNLLLEAVRGNRVRRFDIAEKLSKVAGDDPDALRYALETWQTFWRDVVLLMKGAPVKPCNSDRVVELQQWAQRLDTKEVWQALHSTRTLLYRTLNTNANVRLALEVLMLDYPRY